MRFILRYTAGAISSACVFLVATEHLGAVFGFTIGVLFNILYWNGTLPSTKVPIVKLPGTFIVLAKKRFGFNLNDREFILNEGELVQVNVKEQTNAIRIKFLETIEEDDSILNATHLGEL